MKSMVVAAGILSALFCFSTAGFAYETVEVKNGGSIEGVAEFAGAAVPKDKMVTLSSETAYCGKSMPAETYLIKDRKIKNVVVYIEEIKAGKAVPAEPVTLTNLKCAFEPHVVVGFKGGKFVERNDDTIFHNIHTYLNGKTMYNIGLPEKGASVTKPLTKAGLIEVTCDSHPWMHGYVYVSENPYAAVTDEKGAFTIDNIPPGTYAVEAWHEALGKVKLTNIKVESGKAVKVKVEFKK
jgi:polysaccharide lyase family 4-like protein